MTGRWRGLLCGVLPGAALLAVTACGSDDGVEVVPVANAQPGNVAFVDQVRTDQVMADVGEKVVDLLSYRFDDTAEIEQDSRGLTTGDFRDEYGPFVRDSVIPAAQAQQIVATTEIAAEGVQELHGDTVTMLFFLNQKITTASATQSVPTGSRIVVTAEFVGGHWLVSALDPV